MKLDFAAGLLALGFASTPVMASKCRISSPVSSPSVSSSSVSSLSVSSLSVSSSSVSSPSPSPSTVVPEYICNPGLLVNPDFTAGLAGWDTYNIFYSGTLVDCIDGKNCAQLLTGGSLGQFKQTVATTVGTKYTFSFLYENNMGTTYDATVYYSYGTGVDGTDSLGPDGTASGSGRFIGSFTASASSTTLVIKIPTTGFLDFRVADFSLCPTAQ